jgi:mannosyltransferase
VKQRIGRDWLWVGLIVSLGWALRLYRLGEQSLWLDEGSTWYRAMLPLGQGLKELRQVFTHPPLYHLLSFTWTRVGNSEWLLRFPETLIAVFTIPLLYHLGRRLGGRPLGLLTALLLAVNPFHIWYSRDARDYTLVTLLTLIVWANFVHILDGGRVWWRFTLFSGLLYFTHYFGLLSPLAQFIYLTFNLRRFRLTFRRWVIAQAVAFLPLLGWLICLFTQETKAIGIGWIPRPAIWSPLVSLWNFVALYLGAPDLLTVVTLALFTIALVMALLSRTRSTVKPILFLWLLAPPVVMVLVSWITERYLYVDRYFIGGLPALLLLVSWGTLALARRQRLAGIGLAMLLLVTSLANTARIYSDPLLRKVDWRGALGYVQTRVASGDLVVMPSLEYFVIMRYYDGDPEWDYLTSYAEEKDLDSMTADRRQVWLILNTPHESNHLVTESGPFDVYTETDSATASWLIAHRSDILDEQHFAGLTVLLVRLMP